MLHELLSALTSLFGAIFEMTFDQLVSRRFLVDARNMLFEKKPFYVIYLI